MAPKQSELADLKKPDIILLDVELPDERGDLVLLRILAKFPDIKILAVSAYHDRQYILEMLGNGASGYLTKDEISSSLLKAVRWVIQSGKNWDSQRALEKSSLPPAAEPTLTRMEVNILKQLVDNRSENEIADVLDIDISAIHKYLDLLMKKHSVDSLAKLKVIGRQYFSHHRS